MSIPFLFLILSTGHAALNDAYSLVQISRGIWRVQCQDQSIFQVSTREILNNQICGTRTYDPQECFDATVNGMNSFEYDSLAEIQEINNACAQGDFSTAACIVAAKNGLPSFEYDRRDEGIEIITACTSAIRRGTSNPALPNCIDVATSALPSFEYDRRDEVIEIVRTCAQGSSTTPACIVNTINSLPSYEYDRRDEMLAIIQSCN